MREIKFRVWDEGEKRFWYFLLQDILERRIVYRGSWDEKVARYKKAQYTGLKDKNGVEIYEGDILKSADKYNEIVSVVWNHGEFQLRLEFKRIDVKGQEYTHHAYIKIYPHRYIVIGNIYEHPHLLEASE